MRALIAFVLLAALGVAPQRAAAAPPGGASDCVVLLHGLARSPRSMQKMADALAGAGYRVANVGYPSRDYRIETLAPLAVGEGLQQCGDEGRVHFVTHSLGGILVRYYFAENDVERVGRVVMLGPPNQGSDAADAMQDIPGFTWLNGPAGHQLGKGEASVPLRLGQPAFEFAIIAGNRSIDPISSAVLPNPDDGKVSVVDTMLEGMADFKVLPVSHAYIMKNDQAIDLVRRFLKRGSFTADD